RILARPSLAVKLAVTIAVVGVMVSMRLGLYAHRVMPIAFSVPLIAFIWLMDRRLLWITAGLFALATLIKYLVLLPVYSQSGHVLPWHTRTTDAALVLFELLVVTFVVHVLIGVRDRLEGRNAELTAANEELAAR